MKQQYDVIVVGAGPAGLLAAKALAQNGFDVAVLERKSEVGLLTRTCGQSLLPPNEYFFGDLFHYNARDRKFCFANSGLAFPYTGAVKNLYTWHMYSPNMQKMQFGLGPDKQPAPIALSYDKETMLSCLLDDVRGDHVAIHSGTECTDIGFQPGSVVVTAGDKSFTGRCVIAADGTNSRIAEKLGFNRNRRHIANLYVKSYFVTGFKPPLGDCILTGIIFIKDKPVYVFLLPRPEGEAWNFLLLTFESSVDLEAAYEAAVSSSGFAPWFSKPRKQREFAAVEAIHAPIVKPFRNNVLITGDAGSCQELECLGAMLSGWKAGLAVAAALKEQHLGIMGTAISQYEDWWLNTYIKQYDYQDYLSVFGIAYMFSKPEIVDYVFGLMPEPFPPTFNPYTAVKFLGQRLQGIMPRIMAERPDILQQLAGTMLAFPSDVVAQTLER